MDNKEWRSAPSPFNMYEVSNMGEVRHGTSNKKIQLNKKTGYNYVILHSNGMIKSWTINRLILSVFVGSRDRTFDARHLDGDRSNNVLSNLAWGSRKENESDKRLHGKAPIGSNNGQSKLTDNAVRNIRRRYKQGMSSRAIANIYGVCQQNICSIVNLKTWKHV